MNLRSQGFVGEDVLGMLARNNRPRFPEENETPVPVDLTRPPPGGRQCEKCLKVFSSRSPLIKHRLICVFGRKFRCSVCRLLYVEKYNLVTHIIKRHQANGTILIGYLIQEGQNVAEVPVANVPQVENDQLLQNGNVAENPVANVAQLENFPLQQNGNFAQDPLANVAQLGNDQLQQNGMAEDNPVVNEAQLEDEMMQDNGVAGDDPLVNEAQIVNDQLQHQNRIVERVPRANANDVRPVSEDLIFWHQDLEEFRNTYNPNWEDFPTPKPEELTSDYLQRVHDYLSRYQANIVIPNDDDNEEDGSNAELEPQNMDVEDEANV